MMPKVEERPHGLGGLGPSYIQTNKHLYIYIQNNVTINNFLLFPKHFISKK
jgi:hypothetical protein